jgi:hypothetical protein
MTSSQANLQHLLHEIRSLKGKLDAVRPLDTATEERLWNQYRLDWNYHSNRLAGQGLNRLETELLLLYDQLPGVRHTLRELEAMKGHDEAVARVREWSREPKRRLTEDDLRELNALLLARPPGPELHPLSDLLSWYRIYSFDNHPVLAAAELHYELAHLHPFTDGNGRLARLLLNYHLLQHGFPPVVIHSDDQAGYLAALRRADAGDGEAFGEYVARRLVDSLERALGAARGEWTEDAHDWEREVALLERRWLNPPSGPERSQKLLTDRLKDSVLPLLQLLSARLARFDRLFSEARRTAEFALTEGVFSIDLALPELAVTGGLLDQAGQELREITVRFEWSGALVPFPGGSGHLEMELVVGFEPFQYEIWFPGRMTNLVSKHYTQSLSEAEQKAVLDTAGNFLLEKIRN